MTIYNPNIPAASDFLSDSQLDIKNNFSWANTTMGVNHIDFATITNSGKHKFVEMPNYTPTVPDPVPPGLANFEGTLYTESDGSRSQLFYTNDATGKKYQLTTIQGITFAQPLFGQFTNDYNPGSGAVGGNYDGGWTFLPGGLLFQYGQASNVANLSQTKFPVPFPKAVFNIQLTIIQPAGGRFFISLAITDQIQFACNQLNNSGTGVNLSYFWQAIGN